MKHGALRVIALCVACLGLAACDQSGSGLASFFGASSLRDEEVASIEKAVKEAEMIQVESSPDSCRAAIDAAHSNGEPLEDGGETDCTIALALLPNEEESKLAELIVHKGRGLLATALALEGASHRKDGSAWMIATQQLLAATGPLDTGYGQVEPRAFAAASAAAMRSADLGSSDAETLLAQLESVEFPLRGARPEPLWRALYFGRFDQVEDTISTRRHVAGIANALVDLCGQWEPPGIRSVAFDTGLETYLAPVRAQVPKHLIDAVPKVAGSLRRSFETAREEAGNRGAEQWLAVGMSAVQGVKRQVLNSVALGSVAGRDAAQILYSEVGSCRSPRGQRFIRSLMSYWVYTAKAYPIDNSARVAKLNPARTMKEE